MRKLLIVAIATLMCGSSFAQTTGPTPQTDTMNKPGMPGGTKSKMKKMKKSGMTGTKGSDSMPTNDMQKSSMGSKKM